MEISLLNLFFFSSSIFGALAFLNLLKSGFDLIWLCSEYIHVYILLNIDDECAVLARVRMYLSFIRIVSWTFQHQIEICFYNLLF